MNKKTISRKNYILTIIGCFAAYILIHLIFNPANFSGARMTAQEARSVAAVIGLIYTAAFLPVCIIFFNTIRKRLWDAGRTAWFTPIAAIPIIGLLFLIILAIIPTKKQPSPQPPPTSANC
jgi:uncharacterized membrane protein YhaH (DUF805 family)